MQTEQNNIKLDRLKIFALIILYQQLFVKHIFDS